MKQGWEIVQLGNLCEIQLGKTPHRKTDQFWDKEKESNNVWLSISDMKHGAVMHDSKEYVSDLGAEIFKITPKGTLMLSFKLTLGRVAFAGSDLLTNEAIASLINLDNKIDQRFLFYYFTFFDWDEATRGDEKVKGKTLNKAKLKKLPIIVPPLEEQKQIVAKLDQCFEAIDKAKANAAKNLENAKELFHSTLDSIFGEQLKYESSKTLNNWCELIVDCEHKTAPAQTEGYPSIRTPNIGKGELILENVRRVSEETYNLWTRRATPESNDLIMAREAPAGNVALIPKNIKVCLGQRTLLIRPLRDSLSSNYLMYLLLSPLIQKNLLSHSTGSTVLHVNMKDIRNLKIGEMPDKDTQKKIVDRIQKIVSSSNKLKSKYQQELNSLEELKKSILQKAFEGEL